jgi:6,7-dimethyl-8-ribityllumazine synthase
MSEHTTNKTVLTELEMQNAKSFHFALVTAEWNIEITDKLRDGAFKILAECSVPMEHIYTLQVPGSFEIPLAAKWAIEHVKADAVICLGCIIKGETRHDEYLASSVTQTLLDLSVDSGKPIALGVLTVENIQQAEERAGGALGNKGEEVVITAIKMLSLKSVLNR